MAIVDNGDWNTYVCCTVKDNTTRSSTKHSKSTRSCKSSCTCSITCVVNSVPSCPTVIVAGGKTIKFDKKGVPKIIDLPAKELKEVNTHNERAWRNAELDRADTQLKIAEDGDGVGTVEEWREYRKSLRKWPEDKKFPDSSFRPKAPDAEVTNA